MGSNFDAKLTEKDGWLSISEIYYRIAYSLPIVISSCHVWQQDLTWELFVQGASCREPSNLYFALKKLTSQTWISIAGVNLNKRF